MNKAIPIQNRDQITQMQVGTVLSTIATMIPLINRHDSFNSQIDEGAMAVVEGTLINACHRLDTILMDDSRWNIEGICRLETHLANLYHEHAKTLKLQQQQMYDLQRPHIRHNPQLGRLTDGSWIAFLGDPNDLNNAVIGVGGCPAQALEAFDEMFNGRVPSHLQAWIAIREEALQQGLRPPTKQEYDHHKKIMDGTGNHGPEANESSGIHPRPDSDDAGPDEEIGGDQAGPSPKGPKGPSGPSDCGI